MSKAKFMALAAAHGIEVEYTQGRVRHPRSGEPVAWTMTLDAPEGQWFVDSGCALDCSLHGEIDPNHIETAPDWAKCRARLTEIISHGFESAQEELA